MLVHTKWFSLTFSPFPIQVKAAEASLTKLARPEQEGEGAAYTSVVSNAELEAALASLHLRDLRCQQLSLEITKVMVASYCLLAARENLENL